MQIVPLHTFRSWQVGLATLTTQFKPLSLGCVTADGCAIVPLVVTSQYIGPVTDRCRRTLDSNDSISAGQYVYQLPAFLLAQLLLVAQLTDAEIQPSAKLDQQVFRFKSSLSETVSGQLDKHSRLDSFAWESITFAFLLRLVA